MKQEDMISGIPNFNRENVTFFPGSDWLYFKIFINPGAIDLILTEVIKQVINDFERKNSRPLSYFFVRYFDTSHHLRIRFKVTTPNEIGLIIHLLNIEACRNINIKKIVIDTYLRELERYQEIDKVEELFCLDSAITLDFLSLNTHKITSDIERFSFVIFRIENYLNSFGLNEEEKLNFAKIARDNFFLEFNADKILKKKLNLKFREFYPMVIDYRPDNRFLKVKHDEITKLCRDIEMKTIGSNQKSELLWSIIHMHVNRIFNRKQRFYELIVYDFLEKYYRKNIGVEKWRA